MRTKYTLSLGFAYSLWWRSDLGPKPKNIKDVAEVLREAEIEIYSIHHTWLKCEPRPSGIWEALTGKLPDPDWVRKWNCPLEQPGQVLRVLADKGIKISE